MVVNAPDSPIQAKVIFVIETTSANSVYINELKTNYIVPTLEYFHGGALEEGIGSGSVYGIVAYQAADCHPDLPVSTYGPFTCPQAVINSVDELQFIGGHAENRACVIEALTAALECLDELGGTGIPLHMILLCCSPPYSTYTGGLVPPGAPGCVEQAARLVGERGAQLSVAAARRVPALLALYEHAGGELHAAQLRNYAKDPRHLVLLRGYSLKERPPSPAPPPAPMPPLAQAEVFGQARTAVPQQKVPQVQFQRGTVGPVKSNFLAPPRQAPYANSALLTQLAQPSYPPPPTQSSIQRMVQPGPSNAGVNVSSSQGVSVGNIGMNMQSNQGVGTVGGVGVNVTPQGVSAVGGVGVSMSSQVPAVGGVGSVSAPLQRTYIWSGVLEWMEKGKAPGDQKIIRQLPCQVSANSKEVEPELKADTWPNKLLMQLMHKQLISNIGGQYLKDSKSVLFHLQQNEALDALTKVMVGGFAGCVHFSPMPSPPQCDIKVLILLYTPDKKAYLGFIPNNQATFVDRLRKVIQQQKMSKQLPAPGGGAPPSSLAGGGMQPGMAMGAPSMSGQQPQQHAQGMMMGGGMGGQ
ncbi:unnamed protein product, partial [Brenthis ino]